MRVSSYQPYFLPFDYWWARLAESDVFVLSDDLQFNRNHWYHRTMVGGKKYTVPVCHTKGGTGDPIREKRIFFEDGAYDRLTEELTKALSGKPFSESVVTMIREEMGKRRPLLADLNLALIDRFLDYLHLREGRKILLGTEVKPEGRKSDRVFDIMCKVGANPGGEYICGQFGWGYLDHERFRQAGMSIRQQDWRKHYAGNVSIAELCAVYSPEEAAFFLGKSP